MKQVWEVIQIVFIVVIGLCSFLLLVSEAESVQTIIISKLIAVLGFVVCYLLIKWCN